jgi:integrase/recombinase XerD
LFDKASGQTKAIAATSVARVLAAVRGLHNFWLVEGSAENDEPGSRGETPKNSASICRAKALSVSQVEALLDAAGPSSGFEVVRVPHLRMVPLLCETGALLELPHATGWSGERTGGA